jgi:hypothetical protein
MSPRLVVAAAVLLLGAVAQADPPTINPYRVWWSFPADDKAAIEVDDPDLSVTRWETRWEFARDMQPCNQKASQKLAQRRDKSVREVRIETLDGEGQVRATSRCVMTLPQWRKRLGERLLERLESELDAHDAFLRPRRYPGMPQNPDNPPEKALEDDKK